MKSSAATVAAYLKQLPADRQAPIKVLRSLIKKAAPDADETVLHGMPFYGWHGPLFAIASQKHYYSLYVFDTDVLDSFRPRLKGLNVGKSCIRFRTLEELPIDVVTELLTATVERSRRARRVARS